MAAKNQGYAETRSAAGAATYAIRNSHGAWFTVDDRGNVVWVCRGMRSKMDMSTARAVVASYGASTARRLQVVAVGAGEGEDQNGGGD